MGFALRSAVVTDPGHIRSNNEDSAFAGVRLVAVADGMGGLPAGELASEIVIRVLRPLEDELPPGDPERVLRIAISEANEEILETADADPDRFGMGTTATAILLHDDVLHLIHVGDSRAYLYRDGVLSQLTIDDTYVQMLVDAGELDAAEARHHPQRSLVMQALQGGDYEPHCERFPPMEGDRLLLCSDGLSDVITDETVATVLAAHGDTLVTAEQLVKLTLAAGAPDNVTVIIADLIPTE